MTENSFAYKQNYTLPHSNHNNSSSVDVFKNICVFMQDIAATHASLMGISVNTLQAANITWVLARQQVLLNHLPAPGEQICIETWPSLVSRVQCRRDFRVYNLAGKQLGQAISYWVVLNMQTRRAERVPDFIRHAYPQTPSLAVPEISIQPKSLPKNSRVTSFKTSAADIDINKHVTSMRYLDFMLAAVPKEVRCSQQLKLLDVVFRAEGMQGDSIASRLLPATLKETMLPKQQSGALQTNETGSPKNAPQTICTKQTGQESFLPLFYKNSAEYWHNLVKEKNKTLFFSFGEEKELVRGYSLWHKS